MIRTTAQSAGPPPNDALSRGVVKTDWPSPVRSGEEERRGGEEEAYQHAKTLTPHRFGRRVDLVRVSCARIRMVRLYRRIAIALQEPAADGLTDVVEALTLWQREGAPIQLHRGELGCTGVWVPTRRARALRVWSRDEEIFVGFVDRDLPTGGAGDPHGRSNWRGRGRRSRARAGQRLGGPSAESFFRGYRPWKPGSAGVSIAVECAGWVDDERWTSLYRNLAEPSSTAVCGWRPSDRTARRSDSGERSASIARRSCRALADDGHWCPLRAGETRARLRRRRPGRRGSDV